MTLTDYIIDIALIGIVLVQVRGRRLSTRSLLLPLGIVAYVAITYLKAIPTAGNDLVLIIGCATLGAILGGLCALFTSLRPDGAGDVVAKAGAAAAILWVAGVGTRLAFQLYATNGGGAAIGRFSIAHHITSANAWTAALILMALAEAVARTAGIFVRWQRAQALSAPAPALRAPSGQYGAQ